MEALNSATGSIRVNRYDRSRSLTNNTINNQIKVQLNFDRKNSKLFNDNEQQISGNRNESKMSDNTNVRIFYELKKFIKTKFYNLNYGYLLFLNFCMHLLFFYHL